MRRVVFLTAIGAALLPGWRRQNIEPERLPEDPVLAAMASARWREHLASEERERKLAYDRRKLEDHRAALAILRSARKSYDGANTRQARMENDARSTVAELRQLALRIDRWGVNSNLLDDYAAMSFSLGNDYPRARIAAIGGNREPLAELQSSWDAREAKIVAWLDEAERADDGR